MLSCICILFFFFFFPFLKLTYLTLPYPTLAIHSFGAGGTGWVGVRCQMSF